MALDYFKIFNSNLWTQVRQMINRTYLNDIGIIIKVLENNYVVATSLQKRMGVYKTIKCKYVTPCSSSFAVEIEPLVGDKVRIVSLQHLETRTFEAEEPYDSTRQNGYGEMSCVCIPVGAYTEEFECKVKIQMKQESVKVSSKIPVSVDCGNGSITMNTDGTVEINENFKVLV